MCKVYEHRVDVWAALGEQHLSICSYGIPAAVRDGQEKKKIG